MRPFRDVLLRQGGTLAKGCEYDVQKGARNMIFKRNRRAAAATIEVAATLKDLQDWEELISQNPHFCDRAYLREIALGVVGAGAIEPLTNVPIPPGALQYSDNLREGLAYSSLNSRMRMPSCSASNGIWRTNPGLTQRFMRRECSYPVCA